MKHFFHTFQYFFNWEGMAFYAFAIICVKIVHEFSHAFVAKAMGARVPVMGVAFIVLWPVAFCNTTDAWRISRYRERLLIAAAGIIAELAIAGICLVGWTYSQPGVWQSLFFVVSTASLLSTLVVNLNPAMSFDGYYLLMDASRVDNLRDRAFKYTRYFFRRVMLGMNLSPPEALSRKRKIGFVVYSVYAWLYRFFLYLGIALVVYYKFMKVVGIFLFLVEIWWFIAMPVVQEVKALITMRRQLTFNKRLAMTCFCIAAVVVWASVPVSRSVHAPAIMEAQSQTLYAPFDGLITSIAVERGQDVKAGNVLLQISSPSLIASEHDLVLQQKRVDSEINLLFLKNSSL